METQQRRIHIVLGEEDIIKLGKHNSIISGDLLENDLHGTTDLVISTREGIEVLQQRRERGTPILMIERSLIRYEHGSVFLGRYIPGFEIAGQYRKDDNFEKYKQMLVEAGIWEERQ